MAAFGGSVSGASGGSPTFYESPNLNVTGTDLALVVGGCELGSTSPVMTASWDPAGNNEAMTGTFDTIEILSGYGDMTLQYLDNPTPANAPARIDAADVASQLSIVAIFFTNAADIVGTDTASDTEATTAPSVTVPSVATGDMVVDFLSSAGTAGPTLAVGANQTERENFAQDSFGNLGVSTQAGADGGVMSWTVTGSTTYGTLIIGARIPDAGGTAALTSSGTPDLETLTASGVANQVLLPSGTPDLAELTAVGVATLASSVVITDVDGDESWVDGDANLVVTGTGFV